MGVRCSGGGRGRLYFSSREKDGLLQWKFLPGDFQGRSEEREDYFWEVGLAREWFIGGIPEYTRDLPQQCQTNKCRWLLRWLLWTEFFRVSKCFLVFFKNTIWTWIPAEHGLDSSVAEGPCHHGFQGRVSGLLVVACTFEIPILLLINKQTKNPSLMSLDMYTVINAAKDTN